MVADGHQLSLIGAPDLKNLGTGMGDPERTLYASGCQTLMGVDEVGRGPLAGSVVAAAVILPNPLPAHLQQLNDSKKLTETKRNALFEPIRETALAYGIGEVGPAEIDRINIFQATFEAMRRAISNATQHLAIATDIILVDGKYTIPGVDTTQAALIKGDGRSYAIAAASILAKVTRDRQMCEADAEFPHYGFARHKGYGTLAHRRALTEHGPCILHRRSFRWQTVDS